MGRRKRNNPLQLTGVTTDGRAVFRGTFKLADTYGFPLAISLDEAAKRGVVINLGDHYEDARQAGWPAERAERSIREALVDTGTAPKTIEYHMLMLDLIERKRIAKGERHGWPVNSG